VLVLRQISCVVLRPVAPSKGSRRLESPASAGQSPVAQRQAVLVLRQIRSPLTKVVGRVKPPVAQRQAVRSPARLEGLHLWGALQAGIRTSSRFLTSSMILLL